MDAVTLEAVAAAVGGTVHPGDAGHRAVDHVVIDSRLARPGALFVALPGERTHGADHAADALGRGAVAVMGAGDPPATPFVQVDDPAAALWALGAYARGAVACPTVAVTGSNGKTTVKRLLRALLETRGDVLATEGNLNNHLGVPLTLCRLASRHDYAVLELGANHPGEIRALTGLARPHAGIVTQAAPAHLEGFGSLDGVARAKGELFETLAHDAVAVINADDPYAPLWRQQAGGRTIVTFGAGDADSIPDVAHRGEGASLELAVDGVWHAAPLQLPGRHNAANAAAAVAGTLALGLSAAEVVEALRAGLPGVTPEAGRLQPLPGRSGCRILDDSYNANPASLQAALDHLAGQEGTRWLLLGAMGELGADADAWHRAAGERARAAGVDTLWTVGGAAPAAEGFGAGARAFDTVEELTRALGEAAVDERTTVLVKGSRSAGMEAAVGALREGGR